jgi:hypothetical protein
MIVGVTDTGGSRLDPVIRIIAGVTGGLAVTVLADVKSAGVASGVCVVGVEAGWTDLTDSVMEEVAALTGCTLGGVALYAKLVHSGAELAAGVGGLSSMVSVASLTGAIIVD